MSMPAKTFLILFGICALIATRGHAAPLCLPHDQMTAALARTAGEAPLATALLADGALLTFYTSPKGAWTMTRQLPAQPSCIVAAGESFDLLHRDGLFPAKRT